MNERFSRGMSKLTEMVSKEEQTMMEGMKDISPDLWEMIVSFGFGDVYGRKGLSLAEREMVTITSLITQGAFDQLEVHIKAALNVGLTENKIKEIIIQCAAYAGFPKAVQAMKTAGKVFGQ